MPWPTPQTAGGAPGGWPSRPSSPGASPWGNAPPNIAAWLDANWGDKRPPVGPGPAVPPAGWPQRAPTLNGRVPLGAGRGPLGGIPVNPRDFRNPGDPMSGARMSPVPMSNPPPPGSLLAALFNAKGPLPPPGFPGAPLAPTGLPMGVRGMRNPVDFSLTDPANQAIQAPGALQSLQNPMRNPVTEDLTNPASQAVQAPNARFNSLFGSNFKPWFG